MEQPLTRGDARRGWEAFLPKVSAYGQVRNHVLEGHPNVSRLSAALRFRTLLEDEVIEETLGAHSFAVTEKWLQEVCWRRYWKGWLERRPQVWSQWRQHVRRLRWELPEKTLARARAVMAGKSGVECMDRMARELLETGYLHNHARMWWASFWIHVERLPWELGADFFFRQLVDADPASNTLSWRWVAGLQTPGKTYMVRLSNIQKYAPKYRAGSCQGDSRLTDSSVCEVPETVDTKPQKIRECPEFFVQGTGRLGLWLHPDDLTPERGPLQAVKPESVAACICDTAYREVFGLSPRRIHSLHAVLQDGVDRARRHYGCAGEAFEAGDPVAGVVGWAQRNALEEVVALAPTVGPTGDLLPRMEGALKASGVRLRLVRRASDALAFSLASEGFFRFWQKMSGILRETQRGEGGF